MGAKHTAIGLRQEANCPQLERCGQTRTVVALGDLTLQPLNLQRITDAKGTRVSDCRDNSLARRRDLHVIRVDRGRVPSNCIDTKLYGRILRHVVAIHLLLQRPRAIPGRYCDQSISTGTGR